MNFPYANIENMLSYAKFKPLYINDEEAGVACHSQFSSFSVILHCASVFVYFFQHIIVFGLYYFVK